MWSFLYRRYDVVVQKGCDPSVSAILHLRGMCRPLAQHAGLFPLSLSLSTAVRPLLFFVADTQCSDNNLCGCFSVRIFLVRAATACCPSYVVFTPLIFFFVALVSPKVLQDRGLKLLQSQGIQVLLGNVASEVTKDEVRACVYIRSIYAADPSSWVADASSWVC